MKRRRKKSNLRVGINRKSGPSRGQRILAGIILVVALTGAGVFGVRAAWGFLFKQNDRFTVKKVEIKAGEVITPQLVREYTRIREGMNIFAVDVADIRSRFLEQCPNVKTMTISRQLPDTVRIEVVERRPIARMGHGGRFVVDSEGCVFVLHGKRLEGLPVITGYHQDLRPGDRVRKTCLAALQVLDACDNPRLGLSVEAINAAEDDCLVLDLSGQVRVRLAWPKMGEDSARAREHLLRRLGRVARALQSDRGRDMRWLDATLEDRIYGK
jgi:cell division septal protein FtsQ